MLMGPWISHTFDEKYRHEGGGRDVTAVAAPERIETLK
jgi:hypothetical protein